MYSGVEARFSASHAALQDSQTISKAYAEDCELMQ